MKKGLGLVALVLIGMVVVAVMSSAAPRGTEEPSALMLWVATAIGGVGGVLVVQALKRLIDKVLPEPIGRKAMFYVSWIVSFACGIAAYVLFPEGRALIAKEPFAIFQAGSTVSALAAAIYRLIAQRLGFSRDVEDARPAVARPHS